MRSSAAEVVHWANAMHTPGLNFAETVYPGYQGLVIASGQLRTMTWGFPVRLKHMKPTSKPKPVTNARNDKLHSSFWKPSFEARRCLIPSCGDQPPSGATLHNGHGDSCEQMAEVHDRMPVVLKLDHWAKWTEGSPAEAFDLVQTWCAPLAIDRTDRRWGRLIFPVCFSSVRRALTEPQPTAWCSSVSGIPSERSTRA